MEKSLKTLRPEGLDLPSANPSLKAEVDSLVTWMEPRHALLLRTLIDSVEEKAQLPGSPDSLVRMHAVFGNLRRDSALRFAEFREKWVARLEAKALLPFLDRNQWIVPHPQGGVTLAGKGTRKEARLLYLQTLHDMASDAARQWASLAGRLQALAGKLRGGNGFVN